MDLLRVGAGQTHARVELDKLMHSALRNTLRLNGEWPGRGEVMAQAPDLVLTSVFCQDGQLLIWSRLPQ
ncbi:hypothetical protein RRG08_048057 [Elysia crispata]|uniref:Uncharacterized protein n=1 Tax=Elysia crispata TaxID=231223 RepID=A0AAE0Z2H2_9GAST|nr:hypothetical protein RRG08_048057 [Elysia crispata]